MSKRQKRPINFYERQIIEVRLRGHWSYRKIAVLLERHHSDISREVKRNKPANLKYYSAVIAQKLADQRAKKSNKKKLIKDPVLLAFVSSKLKEDWSPQQIAGRLKKHPPHELVGKIISHESIYKYIYEEEPHLYHYLRCKKTAKRQKRFSRKNRAKNHIKERVSIHDRPNIINQKKRFSDWESDSVKFAKQKKCLSVQHERKSLLVRIHKMENNSAEETYDAIISSIESLPQHFWKSLTFDNGKEGACHIDIKNNYNIKTFFCDPYASYQKGGVENSNRLIRQYLPRKINLDNISEKQIYEIQEKINNRPRKKLKYKTPNEIVNKLKVVQ